MNPILTLATTTALFAAGLQAQMGKRWIDQYSGTIYAQSKPAVGAEAPDLRLWDLDGRPRSLHLERGRKVVLIAGSYT
ncbi:MAG: hypothetical protein KAI24_17735 [Planctomycetes bacterium]|nr:hypothetical protein [Planctomycetota bacterium]